jgi:6-phosphogluconolactonase
MSFLTAACAARAGQHYCHNRFRTTFAAAAIVSLALLSLSCGNSGHGTAPGPDHNAYVTLPARGSVLLLHISGATGAITLGAETPQVENATPTGLALLPNKKFLYAMNSLANTISIFAVNGDASLSLTATPTPVGFSPNDAVIDPSGKFLLVTNNFGNNVSVYSIDSGTGALSEVAGSPFSTANSPTNILITPSGKFVFVTSPGIGFVTAFSFANGVLTPVPGSPIYSGAGAAAVAVDSSERYLYVVNPQALNPPPLTTIGNISAFNIDPNTGALTNMAGSPFTAANGIGPTAITVDPTGKFVYAFTPQTSNSVWCFSITADTGQLVAVLNSPFGVNAGGLFALFDPIGNNLYVGNQTGNGVSALSRNLSTGAPTAISGSPFPTHTAPGKMVLAE